MRFNAVFLGEFGNGNRPQYRLRVGEFRIFYDGGITGREKLCPANERHDMLPLRPGVTKIQLSKPIGIRRSRNMRNRIAERQRGKLSTPSFLTWPYGC
jgi:hypothetical protein